MAVIRWVLIIALVALLATAAFMLRGAVGVAVGYSAKQLCSGVFVAGLPAEFIESTDIAPRMTLLGPALGSLDLDVDTSRGVARAGLFGAEAEAVHTADEGCVLHGDMAGVPPRSLSPAQEPFGVRDDLRGAVQAAFDEPPGGGRNTLAVLVAVEGELLAERYADPVNSATPLQGWSMNKSLMSTWVGMQAERGALDPTLPVARLAPDVPLDRLGYPGTDERLTLLHLLQMESGLDFAEVYGPGSDVTNMLYRTEAMWTVPASVGHAYPPGQRFAYSSGDTVLASYVWQQSLDRPYAQWIEEEFRQPLDLDTLVAESDASGIQVGSSYVYLTARDWLRVGQLWLDAWHGRTELLSQDWLRASVAPRKSSPRGHYGRGFWLNTGEASFVGVTEDMFYASGNSGQFVVVIPERELVVVRLGLTGSDSASGIDDFLRALEGWQP